MRSLPFVVVSALSASFLVAATGCQKGGAGAGAAVTPKSEEQKTLYALGLVMARNAEPFSMSADEVNYLVQGLRDGLSGAKPQVELDTYGPKLNDLARKRSAAKAGAEKSKAGPALEKAAAEPGAEKLPSGLVYRVLKEGEGASPVATDKVKVHYHGTLADGTVFDSSVKRGEPATFPLNGVIPCWTEGVQKMKVGGKAKLTCPSEIAYGDQGRPGIPGGATLTFEVELLEILK